jgi:hypothetical protein
MLFDGNTAVDGQPRGVSCRHRVTVDLRGMAGRLAAFATARRMTVATSVRRAVEAMLGKGGEAEDSGLAPVDSAGYGPLVKVTLRLPAVHTRLLAMRSRQADVSQGEYVARLIEGTPLAPRMQDHRDVVAALTRSTSSLAALSVDLRAVARTRRDGLGSDAARPPATIDQIGEAVRGHIQMASRLLAELERARRRPSPASGKRARAVQPP